MNEDRLIETLRRIEALHAGATTDGERVAAAEARKRILARLGELQVSDPPIELRIRIDDPWSRRVFNALCRRYGLRPYRYRRQHRQTVMVRVSQRFADETLWPEYVELARELAAYLEEVTERAVQSALGQSGRDGDEVASPKELSGGE